MNRMRTSYRRLSCRRALTIATIGTLFFNGFAVTGADLSEAQVKLSIEQGRKFLISQQAQDGSWSVPGGADARIGVTSLCVLALANSGMISQDPPLRRGLQFLRKVTQQDLQGGYETYQTSLLIMALVAGRERSDFPRIAAHAQRLEAGQLTKRFPGGWGYHLNENQAIGGGPDPSNTQFAILGLRESVEIGYAVDRETWLKAQEYWNGWKSIDGGWGYTKGVNSRGSMTVAAIASLAIVQQMLQDDEGVAADGTPPCCNDVPIDRNLQGGINWLARNFSVHENPAAGTWVLYYVYGIERAGRLSGQRFFGDHDWYREGTHYLIQTQSQIDGSWLGVGPFENHPTIATCYSLLFLSKGLAPVLINKLKYGPRMPNNLNETVDNNWNRHPRDVRNLTDLIGNLPKWPKLLTSQELDLERAVRSGSVNALLQAPVLLITGAKALAFNAEETKLLRDYLEEGGFIFACPTCDSREFEPSFRELVTKLMPPGEGELKPLPAEHPVYRSEFPLQSDTVPLLGVDFGCRTSIIYSPEDLGCLWDLWMKVDPPKRNVNLKTKIVRATQIGVNIMAYATFREPPDKTQVREVIAGKNDLDAIERGLLQIAQIKHDGAWNTAPRALRNLLVALNENVGPQASTRIEDLSLADKNLFRYPVIYMHGRNRFSVPPEERADLVRYLEQGGVLFADSCCGSKAFDKSFREFLGQLFPDNKLERIPITNEIFTEKIGHDIKQLRRRTMEGADNASGGNFTTRTAEPILEGIELDGRYAVIYSKYDISCALERQNSGNCEGYLPEDAAKLGTNIILYSMLQNLRLKNGEGGGSR